MTNYWKKNSILHLFDYTWSFVWVQFLQELLQVKDGFNLLIFSHFIQVCNNDDQRQVEDLSQLQVVSIKFRTCLLWLLPRNDPQSVFREKWAQTWHELFLSLLMSSNIDEGQKLVHLVKPFLKRDHVLLVYQLPCGVKTDDVVAFSHCGTWEELMRMCEYLKSAVALTIILFSTFQHSKQRALATSTVTEQQKPNL